MDVSAQSTVIYANGRRHKHAPLQAWCAQSEAPSIVVIADDVVVQVTSVSL